MFMRSLLFVAACALTSVASAQAPGLSTDCPCEVTHSIKVGGTGAQTIRFPEPFALFPACTAKFANRPRDSLQVTSASRTTATVELGSSVAPFKDGDVLVLSCTLTNRRR